MTWFNQAKKAVESAYKGVKSDVFDESKAHIAIDKFITQTEYLLNDNKIQMEPEAIKAAEGLIREVKALLESDSKTSHNHWPMVQHDLIDNTLDIIHKYQPKLEASPGFWNQLKASVNTLLEQVTGVKNILSVEKTVHGADNSFQENKDTISDMKDEMENGTFSPR